jgi:hypothetical protein
VAGLCSDDLLFETAGSVGISSVCEAAGDKGVLTHEGEWCNPKPKTQNTSPQFPDPKPQTPNPKHRWVYGCCGGENDVSSEWLPSCGSSEFSDSDLSKCSKSYPFVHSVTAYQRAASQVSVEVTFTGTVAAGKKITISGLQVLNTPYTKP